MDYKAARQEWLERYGDYIAQARNWRLMAAGSMVVSALFAAGLVYEANRVKVQPFVVEVDKLGESVQIAQAVQSGALSQPIVTHLIAQWVQETRERIGDATAETATYNDAYNYVNAAGQTLLNAYFADHSPLEAAIPGAEIGSRTVEIETCLPFGAQTKAGGSYQVEWKETTLDIQGGTRGVEHWTGIIEYVNAATPTDAKHVLLNPFGVYVKNFQWQKKNI